MFGDTSKAVLEDIENALKVEPNTNDKDRVNINNLSAIRTSQKRVCVIY